MGAGCGAGGIRGRVRAEGFAYFEPGCYASWPAGARPDYFPLLYAEPIASSRAILGLDRSNEPQRHPCMFCFVAYQMNDCPRLRTHLEDPPDPARVVLALEPARLDRRALSGHHAVVGATEESPTQAILGPYRLDARRCISYLTIELRGPIPEPLRPLIGNRIFGCDDCQLVCPWNRFARLSRETDFKPRHGVDAPDLIALFNWTEDAFLKNTEGSAIRRIGYAGWLRNIAVALGNAPASPEAVAALEQRRTHPSELVREHVAWALTRHATGVPRAGSKL